MAARRRVPAPVDGSFRWRPCRVDRRRTGAAILIVTGLIAAGASAASAHVGTSNAYFEGAAGPYRVRVIVRTPGVIPGLAQASVRVHGGESVERVTLRPLRSDVGLEGAPPPDVAGPVPGEAGLFSGELWLMTAGSYSVEVGVAGAAGEGTVFVPVLALAERRLAMNPAFGAGLVAAALFLFVGAVTIVGAAVRESVLEPGRDPDAGRRRRGRFAMAAFTLILGAVLGGGWIWWDAVDAAYQSRIYRPWNTAAAVTEAGGARILTLAIDDPDWRAIEGLPDAGLLPDHGKLMHMFLVRAGDLAAFAHIHPVRDGYDSFSVPLPPLPAGEYRIYADIVLENGFAPTLVDTVSVGPPGSAAFGASPGAGGSVAAGGDPQSADHPSADPDPDDSWATLRPRGAARAGSYPLASGRTVRWERDGRIAADKEVTLRFSVTEPDGSPSALAPYMGMLSHAAVFRDDGSVFVHLHPAGSINLTAQMRFAETEGAGAGPEPDGGNDRAVRAGGQAARAVDRGHDGTSPGGALDAPVQAASPRSNTVTFPFVFPESGAYRIFVQVKIGAEVETAAFDVEVREALPS
ncbi:MAG: hypothetical protein OXG04_15755 [Acidobacteria bacterium]|nr:hypothetical protein [Acidobacteriota bacterium]